MGKQRKWNDQELILAVDTSRSLAQVIKKIGLVPAGGNYQSIKNRIKELELDTSHFTGMAWARGFVGRPSSSKLPLEEILVEGRSFRSSHLRERLISEGIFERECTKCRRTHWLGLPISLELEHINGIKTDNRLENLTILCPNCHAQTPTYRGRNISRSP